MGLGSGFTPRDGTRLASEALGELARRHGAARAAARPLLHRRAVAHQRGERLYARAQQRDRLLLRVRVRVRARGRGRVRVKVRVRSERRAPRA